ncbi:MAG: RNA-binding S4 domain-containing protein [Lachnospiraceae bacterium]|nr:RNA-binding S4 domain-containing protein [Lachnospiraceae bacterium]
MEITIRDEFIKLGQAMKLAGLAQTGSEAKIMIEDGLVSVNGETELRRGRKLFDGDHFAIDGRECVVRSSMKNN